MLAEVEEGGLVGPLSVAEVSQCVGTRRVPGRRFPIEQSDRTRPIDDFSEFGIDSAFGGEQRLFD